MRRPLFKYFTAREHAEEFLDGSVLFRNLAYFRDHEDAARGDQHEGVSIFKPPDGLVITNITSGAKFTLPMAFKSSVRAEAIFVCCFSETFSPRLADEFGAVACIEIRKASELLGRFRRGLPPGATLKAGRVRYYGTKDDCNPRWALPDAIALAKLSGFAHQDEYRVLFTTTRAFDPYQVQTSLSSDDAQPACRPETHANHTLRVRPLRDICRLHSLPGRRGQAAR